MKNFKIWTFLRDGSVYEKLSGKHLTRIIYTTQDIL